MKNKYAPLIIEILVSEPQGDVFGDLLNVGPDASQIRVSPVRETPPPRDLLFDVGSSFEVIQSVTAVITGIGGAYQTIDWVLTKIRDRRSKTITLKAGATTVTIKTNDDEKQVRALLQAMLSLE